MMYDDVRMAGFGQQQQQQQPMYGAWDWKMEPASPPSPAPPASPFVDLDTDSWFQNGGLNNNNNNSNLAATANMHNQQNSNNHYYNNSHYATCESPDLIVPDTSAVIYNCGDVTKFHVDDVLDEAKPVTRGEAAQKLLNDLDEWIKEAQSHPNHRQSLKSHACLKLKPFSDWYEEKTDLPIFEELETVQPSPVVTAAAAAPPLITRRSDVPAAIQNNAKMAAYAKMVSPLPPQQAHYAKMAVAATPIPVALIGGGPVTPPSTLMQEFDFVLSHHNQQQQQHQEQMLTPPDSPTLERGGGGGDGMTMLQNMPTEELDELVRIRVESLVEGGDDSQCSSSYLSQQSGVGGGMGEEECLSMSGSEGVRSPAPSLEDSSCASDPEWSPPLATKSVAGPGANHSKRRRQSGATGKPYSRPPPEEKRQRKKEQNKNAATRYRLKKKAEIEEILGEERGLIDRNQQLKTDVGELQREIKYLKSLMREMIKRKKGGK